MLSSILQILGVEQKLHAIEDSIEDKAQTILRQGKAAAFQIGFVAEMGIVAVIFAFMALVAGLGSLYFWLAPQFGPAAAMGMIAGGLLVVGGGFAIATVVASKRVSTVVTEAESKPVEKADSAPKSVIAERVPLVEPPRRPVTTAEVDSLFAVAGQFARLPRTGIEPVDKVIQALAPKAEEATREAVAHAANLVRHGDRKTVLAILGSAVVLGWVITKVNQRNTSIG